MAIDYLSYQQDVGNPMQSALQGFSQGLSFADERKKRADIEIEKVRQAEMQRQMQEDIGSLSALKNPTAKDYTSMILKYPQLADHFKQSFEMLNNEQKLVKQNQAVTIFNAINAGQTDLALSILDKSADAARNAGNEQDYASTSAMAKIIRLNPDAAKSSIGMMLATNLGGEKFAEIMDKLQSTEYAKQLQGGVIKQQAADLQKTIDESGLTKAQAAQALANANKLSAETKKLIIEAADFKSGTLTIRDPEKRFDLEKKLRDEYTKNASEFIATQEAYRKVQASQDTAAGDLSLIFAYMKMLDPGSVVREGEFANAQNTTGVPDRVINTYNRLISGERLSEKQRNEFRSQAESVLIAARKREAEVRSSTSKVAKAYGLNEDLIYSAPSQEQPAAPALSDESRKTTNPPAGEQAKSSGSQPSYMRFATGAK